MDREKEIAELKDILKKAVGEWHIVADETTSLYEYVAEKIIDAGYESTDDKMIIPLEEFCREFSKAQEHARKETAKEILKDVKSTLAILMVHGEYCDDWNCGKVIEFIDKVINPVETKFGVEVIND